MNARILMVDDEADAADLFRQHFRREIRTGEYQFDFSTSAEEALRVLESQEPPKVLLLLSDINMPGMSGVELLEKVRGSWPEIAVFMITAYADSTTEHSVMRKGAAHFLTKPVDFHRLKSLLDDAVTASR